MQMLQSEIVAANDFQSTITLMSLPETPATTTHLLKDNDDNVNVFGSVGGDGDNEATEYAYLIHIHHTYMHTSTCGYHICGLSYLWHLKGGRSEGVERDTNATHRADSYKCLSA